MGLIFPLTLVLLGLSGTSEVITLFPGASFWSPDKRLARANGSMVNKGLGLEKLGWLGEVSLTEY
jgi:hypothetical protein